MKQWTAILALACLAASLPPMPKVWKHATGTTQGAGALALIAKPKAVTLAVVLPTGRTNEFAWIYPVGCTPNSWWWNLQVKTMDLRTTNAGKVSVGWTPWRVDQSNVTGVVSVTIYKTNPPTEWRLAGRVTK